MLAETKRLTGWSWETLATTLGCTRQAVHGWTLGREINQDNLARLGRLHAAVKFVDRGSAEANRILLALDAGDGLTWIELLKQGEFTFVCERLGRGTARPSSTWAPLVPGKSADRQHWFDRLAVDGESIDPDAQFALRGEKKRVAIRRRE
ncbi:hypothetical protein [Inquilinus sp. CA228]|uniref:hypothetical protein n=1 Tax=Inquilinus sp. CA228 TaxID=3455609 RepID=UPI003F8D5FBC